MYDEFLIAMHLCAFRQVNIQVKHYCQRCPKPKGGQKWHTYGLNKRWGTPEGTIGVQQSLKKQLADGVEYLLQVNSENFTFHLSKVIRVQHTGDGTNIGKLHVVVFGFTIPEPGVSSK